MDVLICVCVWFVCLFVFSSAMHGTQIKFYLCEHVCTYLENKYPELLELLCPRHVSFFFAGPGFHTQHVIFCIAAKFGHGLRGRPLKQYICTQTGQVRTLVCGWWFMVLHRLALAFCWLRSPKLPGPSTQVTI